MGKIKIIFPKKNLGILIEVNPIRIGGGRGLKGLPSRFFLIIQKIMKFSDNY